MRFEQQSDKQKEQEIFVMLHILLLLLLQVFRAVQSVGRIVEIGFMNLLLLHFMSHVAVLLKHSVLDN